MLSFITEKQSSWEKLQAETRPIFIYGMGDGAEKIMRVFQEKSVPLAGIFASDDFVRGHSFAGYKVRKLSEIEAEVEDFVIVLAFAAGYQSLVDKIIEISQKHTLLVPDVPVAGGGLFTYDYCVAHAQELETVYQLLADEESRRVYANILNFKISGKIQYLLDIVTPKSDIYRKIIHLTPNEVYVDLGAYNGDTIAEVLQYTRGKYIRIYAVEPDRKNFKKLCKYLDGMHYVNAYHAVAWCKDTTVPFVTKAGRQSAVSAVGQQIEARSVDSILQGRPATIIKMDVEGCEREALWGAAQTIAHFSPKLMVSLYHRNEDIFALPLLIQQLNPGYDLYVRHQLYIPAWETNLYAVPSGKGLF
ncbi:MAG: FkbM family methyltransferase [Ruminococcus sp.]|nr:FkbM family methyltransferase [Ruminococcus sp.]